MANVPRPDAPILEVAGLHKKFCSSLKRSLIYGTHDLLRGFFVSDAAMESGGLRKSEFWALQDVNFDLKPGETLGVIGSNGSGKSTLLRVINGIYMPDRGEVRARGRIGSLIALGAGFHPHMSGRENIMLNGVILGMTPQEIREKFDEIVKFADIGDFLDAPVATYSSGMTVRLGFSIAVHSVPEILIIDEVLAVGDVNFQKKCFDKILEFRRKGVATILVSHSLVAMEHLCERGLVLSHGRQVFLGPMRDCVKVYSDVINNETHEKGKRDAVGYRGLDNVTFSNVKVYQEGRPEVPDQVEFGKNIVVEFDYEFQKKETNALQIRLTFRASTGNDIQRFLAQESGFSDGTQYINEQSVNLQKSGRVRLTVFNPRLIPQVVQLNISFVRMDINMHEGLFTNATTFRITEPEKDRLYFEYGSLPTVTEFDYQLTVE